MKLLISQITVPSDRAMPLVEPTVAALAQSIQKDGLINPISVRRDGKVWVLIAGRHRLTACQRLNHTHINVEDKTVNTGDAELDAIVYERMELVENMHRNVLDTAQTADHAKRLKRLAEREAEIKVVLDYKAREAAKVQDAAAKRKEAQCTTDPVARKRLQSEADQADKDAHKARADLSRIGDQSHDKGEVAKSRKTQTHTINTVAGQTGLARGTVKKLFVLADALPDDLLKILGGTPYGSQQELTMHIKFRKEFPKECAEWENRLRGIVEKKGHDALVRHHGPDKASAYYARLSREKREREEIDAKAAQRHDKTAQWKAAAKLLMDTRASLRTARAELATLPLLKREFPDLQRALEIVDAYCTKANAGAMD